MSEISGIFSGGEVFANEKMAKALAHRGGTQKFMSRAGNIIFFDGEIYNPEELEGATDAERALNAYERYGLLCAEKLNGVFAFAIRDAGGARLALFRDRFGAKPLFYTRLKDGAVAFASEIKALFECPGVTPTLNREGLAELFGMLAARTEGFGLFAGISEVNYGSFVTFDADGESRSAKYWELTSEPFTDSPDEAAERVRFLLTDAVKRQTISATDISAADIPLCSLLSGGIDSSIVTALWAKEVGADAPTFSFDFEENEKYFKASSFQCDTDAKWAVKVAELFETRHEFLECGVDDLFASLTKAVDARDMPGMADIDASLLYFCEKLSKNYGVALTGECSDEVFGGYPWFHDGLELNSFPWIRDTEARRALLSDDLLATVDLDAHVKKRYDGIIAAMPDGAGDRMKEISYLTTRSFMTTLLERMDRMGAYSGFAGRIPYADHRLVQYLWDVPWEIKSEGGVRKALLRKAFKDLLPDELINRKKSPFPKTYHPRYEQMLRERLTELMNEPNAPIKPFLNKAKVLEFLKTPSDYGKPWFGQLMAAPQLMAFYLQMNYWLEKYRIVLI